MNTYAVVVQSHTFDAMGTWLVIGLTVACFCCALVLSSERTSSATVTRIGWGVLVALVLATVASTTTYAAIYIPCTDPAGVPWYWFLIWGC